MKKMILSLFVVLTFLQLSCAQKNKQEVPTALSNPSLCQDSVCKIKIESYPQEIAVLIPPYADYKSVSLFFHGFASGKSRDQNLTALMNDLDIVKSFKEATTNNRILIIPFSSGQNKELRQTFKSKSDAQMFVQNVYKAFGMNNAVEDLQIIAHGEAFQTAQDILQSQATDGKSLKISQITLLDATYAAFKPRVYTQWLKSGEHKMTVIYLKNSSTEKKALELWSLFSGQKPGQSGGINLDNADYLTLIPETEFKGVADAHWLVVKKWFGRVL